jgi:hypothetical protein
MALEELTVLRMKQALTEIAIENIRTGEAARSNGAPPCKPGDARAQAHVDTRADAPTQRTYAVTVPPTWH